MYKYFIFFKAYYLDEKKSFKGSLPYESDVLIANAEDLEKAKINIMQEINKADLNHVAEPVIRLEIQRLEWDMYKYFISFKAYYLDEKKSFKGSIQYETGALISSMTDLEKAKIRIMREINDAGLSPSGEQVTRLEIQSFSRFESKGDKCIRVM